MILVTGGAGFIGSNLVAALGERSGAPVYVCDIVDSAEKERNLAKACGGRNHSLRRTC